MSGKVKAPRNLEKRADAYRLLIEFEYRTVVFKCNE